MKKWTKMTEQKRQQVEDRIFQVDSACNFLIENKENITYKKISGITKIPVKTLYDEKYKKHIKEWEKEQIKKEQDYEQNKSSKEIAHLKEIINKQRTQIDMLNLELYKK